jgi:hypothetical protein
MLELPACYSEHFQFFPDEFADQNPDKLKLMVLDNGAFHKAKKIEYSPKYHPYLTSS